MRRLLCGAAGFVLVLIGQRGFARHRPPHVAFALWILGLAILVVAIGRAVESDQAIELGAPVPRRGWTSPRTLVPATVAVATWLTAWWVQHSRPREANRWDLLAVLGLGVGCAFAAAWQPPPQLATRAIRDWWRRRGREIALLVALFGAGMILTGVRLGTFPTTFNGDEGGYSLISRQVVDGTITNPFGAGYLGHPMLGHVVQSLAIWILGPSVTAARLDSSIFGALCVPLAFIVARRLTGSRSAGLFAAGLLLTFPPHLYWSRSALPNVASEFFVLVVLVLLDRAVRRGGTATFVSLGLVVGAAQYFYFSNQVLVFVVAATLGIASVDNWRECHRWRPAVRNFVRRIALVSFGFASSAAPLIGFYLAEPVQFNGRLRQISLLSGGHLDAEASARHLSPLRLIWNNVVSAAMLPFRSQPTGFFRGDVPFVGWPIAILGAVGLAVAISRAGRSRWTGLTAVVVFTVGGLATTLGPTDTNRWVTVIPVMCVAAAVGLHSLIGLGLSMRRTWRAALCALALTVTVAIAGWNLYEFTRGDNRVFKYTDLNTTIAEQTAAEVLAVDGHATVYFSGWPRLAYHGFGNLVYRTPDVHAFDLLEPLTAADDRLPLAADATTIFIAIPERMADLSRERDWYPNGREKVVVRDGQELFRMWIVDP